MKPIYTTLFILFSASLVGIADIFIKKASSNASDTLAALTDPWMIAALGLYTLQVILFAYLFVHKAKLGMVGIIQSVLYILIMVGGGIVLFHEQLTLMKGIGMILGLVAIILLNL